MKTKAYPTELFTSNYQSFNVIGNGRENKIRHEALCFKEKWKRLGAGTRQVWKVCHQKEGGP
jgi:hypothetical protein